MRLGIPDKHAEAITSRPLALHGIARQTRHGSSMTLFVRATSENQVFTSALNKHFEGESDPLTLERL
jgi:uncharacterized protein (DUF1810 family)